jgi:putative transposase
LRQENQAKLPYIFLPVYPLQLEYAGHFGGFIEDGYRESEQSWTEVLLSLKDRGFKSPKLTVGDGALGFWKAVRKFFSQTRSQRCWVHKTANILNKLPKHSQAKAKQYIHDIWMAETRENAEKAFDLFIKTYQLKYSKATQYLEKDREELLVFYDFPADHWSHIRTSNPIESTFSTIRLRTKNTLPASVEQSY